MTTQAKNTQNIRTVGGYSFKSLITNKEYSLSDKTEEDRHVLGIVKQEIIDELRITGITTRLMPYLDLMMIPYWEWIYEWKEEDTKINTVKEQVIDDVRKENERMIDLEYQLATTKVFEGVEQSQFDALWNDFEKQKKKIAELKVVSWDQNKEITELKERFGNLIDTLNNQKKSQDNEMERIAQEFRDQDHRFDEIDDTITDVKRENMDLRDYIDEQIENIDAKIENNGLRLEIKEYIDDAIENETEKRVREREDIEHDHGITQLKVQALEKNAVAKRRFPLKPYLHVFDGTSESYPCKGLTREVTSVNIE